MPAPAVIPAPIAYIKVVAVKKLVVGFWGVAGSVCREGVYWSACSYSQALVSVLN